jgi:hypothetical protein
MFQIFKLLLPALIPSWNFFELVAASPRIEYAQLQSRSEAAADWREFRPRPQRTSFVAMLARLLWNARWNEALFVVSCAERLMDEPTAHSEDEIFHRIAADLAERQEGRGAWLRFRIVLVNEDEGAIARDVAFVSDPRRVETIPVR